MRLSLICCLFVLLSGARGSAASCQPAFPYSEGWLGGDIAYSIPLGDRRSIWLFGDSFVGGKEQKVRAGSTMVANTVALSTCTGDRWNIHYSWRQRGDGSPGAFFESASDKYRYWPMDGFLDDGVLYIALMQVETKPGGGPFGFEGVGVKLARIANPHAEPDHWLIEYQDLGSGKVVFPGVAAIVERPYVYLYAVVEDRAKDHPLILTRVSLEQLNHAAAAIEYLGKDGTWKRGLEWQEARVVIDRGATEMSVRYRPRVGNWVEIQGKPEFPSREIGFRMSQRLEGPWSAWRPLFIVPETRRGSGGDSKDTFCYAAKEHIEFASAADALVTYVCNSLDLKRQIGDLTIYQPKAVRLDLGRSGKLGDEAAEPARWRGALMWWVSLDLWPEPR